MAAASVRLVTPADREEWLRMRTALWPRGAADHEREIDAWLCAPAGAPPVLVAERVGGGVSGLLELGLRDFVEGCTSSPVAYVEGWWVDAELRRRGLGTALMRAAEAWARAQGFRELASDCLLDNEASLRAHEALGFAEVERVICLRKPL